MLALLPQTLLAAIMVLGVNEKGAKAGRSAQAMAAYAVLTVTLALLAVFKVALPLSNDVLALLPALALAAAVHYVR